MNLLVEKVKTEGQPFLAGDHTFWPRPDAKTLKERTFSGGKGVGVSVGLSLQYIGVDTRGRWELGITVIR